jgi:hypothetical protein
MIDVEGKHMKKKGTFPDMPFLFMQTMKLGISEEKAISSTCTDSSS